MKIVFLYSELMPNLLPVFRALINRYSAQIHVVYWDHRKKTPYELLPSEGLNLYRRSSHGYKEIKRLVSDVDPDAIYIAGWMDYTYLCIVPRFRRRGVPVIVGFDDWWRGTVRQSMARVCSSVLTKVLFSHAWVSGPRQYEYAKRLGFDDSSILQNLLSCDTDLFTKAHISANHKKSSYPPIFLYVGRFSPEKGIELLVSGFEKYRTIFNGTWKLLCIGNGPLRSLLIDRPGIEVREFTTQSDLVNAMLESGVFVMASIRDFSPLAVHEAACAGLPMILSTNVGNIPIFLVHNYNGIVFNSGSVDELAAAMQQISTKSTEELLCMGVRSHKLSRRIDPELSAASFVSCIHSK